MSSKPLRIAQISDLHIKPPGALAYGRVDTAKALERCVAALNEFRPRPDFVVISGDLVDTPTIEEYDHLKRLLAPLKLPFAGIPGNHDAREMMRAAFPRAALCVPGRGAQSERSSSASSISSCWIRSVPGKPHGELEAATLQWLDATLAASASRPALLFLHHPPFIAGIWHMDRQNLHNAGELAADRQAPSARAARRHRPRPSRDADDVRRRRLPRSARRPTMRSISISISCARRRSRSSRRPFISTPGFPARDLATS